MLCADEKSSVQALDRTQASLPMTKGRGQTMTHDYKRNGTTTLFAALNVLTGMVIGQCLPRHRHQEFLKFLRTIDREVPKDLQIHVILDNYSTHKHADVHQWLDKHPRFHLHFTPTSSSWLNQVERWFRELTDKALRRGTFGSVPDLIAAIQEYIDAHNNDPKPYVWTATAESILAKVARARTTLSTGEPDSAGDHPCPNNPTRQRTQPPRHGLTRERSRLALSRDVQRREISERHGRADGASRPRVGMSHHRCADVARRRTTRRSPNRRRAARGHGYRCGYRPWCPGRPAPSWRRSTADG